MTQKKLERDYFIITKLELGWGSSILTLFTNPQIQSYHLGDVINSLHSGYLTPGGDLRGSTAPLSLFFIIFVPVFRQQ